MYDWVKAAGQYGSGFGKGLGGFVTDTAEGIKDLAVGGYQLATDASAREAAWETTKTLANTAKQGIDYALDNPTGAVNAVRDTVASAYGDFQAERALAAAEGRLAEFDGQLAGRILPELIPVGKLAKLGKLGKLAKLDKAADLASDAKKLEEAGLLADKAEDAKQALSAVDKAADLSKRAPPRPRAARWPKRRKNPQPPKAPASPLPTKPGSPPNRKPRPPLAANPSAWRPARNCWNWRISPGTARCRWTGRASTAPGKAAWTSNSATAGSPPSTNR